MRILLRGNVSSIEVEGSQEMESERGLIGCEAKCYCKTCLRARV
jgi:hypothetical protein